MQPSSALDLPAIVVAEIAAAGSGSVESGSRHADAAASSAERRSSCGGCGGCTSAPAALIEINQVDIVVGDRGDAAYIS